MKMTRTRSGDDIGSGMTLDGRRRDESGEMENGTGRPDRVRRRLGALLDTPPNVTCRPPLQASSSEDGPRAVDSAAKDLETTVPYNGEERDTDREGTSHFEDVDSARPFRGSQTERSFDRWRSEKRAIVMKLETTVEELTLWNQDLKDQLLVVDHEKRGLESEIARLRNDRRDEMQRVKTIQKESAEREEQRAAVVRSQAEELKQALDATEGLRCRCQESERREAALQSLYQKEIERFAKLSLHHESIKNQLQAVIKEKNEIEERSQAWEEALSNVKRERDEKIEHNRQLREDLATLQCSTEQDRLKMEADVKEMNRVSDLTHSQLERCLSESRRLKNELTDKAHRLKESNEKVSVLGDEKRQLMTKADDLQAKQQAAELHIRSLLEEVERLQEVNAELRAKDKTRIQSEKAAAGDID